MKTAEQRALDELEDAREELERYRGKLFWSVFALLVSIGAVLVGSWFGNFGFGVALCIMGGFGIPLSLIFGGIVMYDAHEDYGGKVHPAVGVRHAQRAHRDAVMDEV